MKHRPSILAIAIASLFSTHALSQTTVSDPQVPAPLPAGVAAATDTATQKNTDIKPALIAPGPVSASSAAKADAAAPMSSVSTSAPPNVSPAPVSDSAVIRVQSPSADNAALPAPRDVSPPPFAPVTTTVSSPGAPSTSDSTQTPSASSAVNDASVQSVVVVATTPPIDMWDRIRAGFTMNDLDDDLVGKWEKYYADRPEYVARIVDRSSKYLFYIVTELERRNMPLEIALLPMIESAFNPIAHSSAKASGIWQFIPSTGTQFGMKQDWWADSRRDIVAATNGALDYLQKLHGMFGDWQLALASYNWGEGSVGRAVARSKSAGRDGSYLSLTMPAETRNYIPKLQAVKNIIRDPGRFGISIASVPNEPYFKTVTLAHAIDLKKAAQLAEMSEAEFVALNPAHHRPVIAGRSDFQILLPAAKADLFISRLEAYENPKVSWRAYKTRPGDRIEALAQRFGTSVAALKSVNGIRAVASTLPAGYNLLVPSDGPSDEALGSIQNAVFTKFPEYVAPRAHRVRKGETFAGIAKRYGVAPATLAQWNRMGKQTARAGQLLYVSGPAPTRAQSKALRAGAKASKGKRGKVVKASSRSSSKAVKRGAAKRRR